MHVASSLAALAAFGSLVVAEGTLQVNTPTTSIQTCHPLLLSWTGGTAPYYITIVDGSNLSDVVEQLNDAATTSTSGTWEVSVAEGSSIVVQVTDATGVTASTAPVTVAAGTDTSCVGQISFALADMTVTGGSATAAASAASGSSAVASAAATTAPAGSDSSAATSASQAKTTSTSVTSSDTSLSPAKTATGTASASAAASSTAAASGAGVVKGSIAAAALGAAVALSA